MLLSKRSEMFLPDNWPSYFSKSKGCKVWDLDGKELLDMSIMGIGTNSLGYGNYEVDTLNEVDLHATAGAAVIADNAFTIVGSIGSKSVTATAATAAAATASSSPRGSST